ncbi:MAG: hypothetical protein J2P22_15020 [Nocardioides sp.]|nr:hypothetical protein [Nocardioides sp.]
MSTLRVEEPGPAAPTRPLAGMRAWLKGVDPLVGVVALVSLVVYLLHGFDKILARDLGLYTYGGQRFLAGDPPYVGVLNRSGPLAHLLPGIGTWAGRLVGLSDVHGARALYMLISVLAVCVVYLAVRDLTRLRPAAVVAAVAFLGFQAFLDAATNGPRDKTAMTLFLLLALLAVVRRRWVTCGVFIAMGTLTWQPVFFVIAPTAAVAVLLAPERRLAALVRIAVGGIAATAVVVFYYILNGALHAFLLGFVLINARYTHQTSAFSQGKIWVGARSGYGPSFWVIIFGFVAVLVLAVVSARAAWRTREAAPATYVALGAGTLVGLAWCYIAYNKAPDLFVMLPFAALGVGGAAAVLLRRLDMRAAVAVTAVLAVIGTTYATAFSINSRRHTLIAQQAQVAAMFRAGPHPSTVLSVQAPQVLVLSGRTNISRYQMFGNGFWNYIDHTFPGGLAGYRAWVEKQAPTFIVVETGFHPRWLEPLLEQHYHRVASGLQAVWWVNKSLPPAERHKIHRASHLAKVGRT